MVMFRTTNSSSARLLSRDISERVLTRRNYSRLEVLTAVDQHGKQRQEQDCGLRRKKHLDAVPNYLPTINDNSNDKKMTIMGRVWFNQRAPFFESQTTTRAIARDFRNSKVWNFAKRSRVMEVAVAALTLSDAFVVQRARPRCWCGKD